MIKNIIAMARQTAEETGRETLSQQVMEAMAKIPRHEFVPDEQRIYAYENHPLTIGYGQTISQPYIVALMTDFLELQPDDNVLEIGTGSGYQTAILSVLAKKVYTIEIIEELSQQAKMRLAKLGYHNVEVRTGDGYYGWQEHAPFDAIIVTAANNQIPTPLVEQLKPNGRMVIPIGERFQVQHLTLIKKDSNDTIKTHRILPVAFVPLTGGHQ